MQGWHPSSSSNTESYQPTRAQIRRSRLAKRVRLAYTKPITVHRAPPVDPQTGIKGLIDDRMAWAREQLHKGQTTRRGES